jgi:small subunit ribosomal protein S3
VGHKVHPYIIRIGINKNWRSLWFASGKDYANNIKEDYKIRQFIKKRYVHAAVSYINIERMGEEIKIKIASARPGIIIGRRGADIDRLKGELAKITKRTLSIDIIEIKNPGTDAQLVAQTVAFQLEKRVAFRRAMKRAIDQAMQSGIPGIKISVAGRLGGAEIARRETYHEGSLPLQTLRADVDYGFAEANTTYGIIGIKVWVFNGIKLGHTEADNA